MSCLVICLLIMHLYGNHHWAVDPELSGSSQLCLEDEHLVTTTSSISNDLQSRNWQLHPVPLAEGADSVCRSGYFDLRSAAFW